MLNFLLEVVNAGVVADRVDPDDIPDGYSAGFKPDMPSFWLGVFLTLAIIGLIWILKIEFRRDKYIDSENTEKDNDTKSDE